MGWHRFLAKVGVLSVASTMCLLVLFDSAGQTSAYLDEVVSLVGHLPAVRFGTATALIDGKIFVIGGAMADPGGDDAPLLFNETMIYDIETGATRYGPSLPNNTAFSACSVGADGRIYVFGGLGYDESGSTIALNTTRIFCPSTNTWSLGASSPVNLFWCSAAKLPDDRILVIGSSLSVNSTLIYDPAADSWTYGADIPHNRAAASIAVWNESAVFVMGGQENDNVDYVPLETDVYDPENDTWTSVSTPPTTLMGGGVTVSSHGNCIYFVGGYWTATHETFDTIYRYDPVSDIWTLSSASLHDGRTFFGNAVTDELGRIFVAGGALIERDDLGRQSYGNLTSIEMIVPYTVFDKAIRISSPAAGGNVTQGTVTIEIDVLSKGTSSAVALDLCIDGASQRFSFDGLQHLSAWNTQTLQNGSYHTIMARVYFSDGSYASDTVQVMVLAGSEELPADDLAEQNAQLRQDFANLSAKLNATRSELSEMAEDVERMRSESNPTDTYAIVAVILASAVVALVVVNVLMSRRTKS